MVRRYEVPLPAGGVACASCGARILPTDVVLYAGIRPRLLSALVDLMVVAAPTIVLMLLVGWIAAGYAPRDDTGNVTRTAVMWITTALASIASLPMAVYCLVTNYLGQSVGKRATGLKVEDEASGERPGVSASAVRAVGQLLAMLTLGVPYAVVLLDARRRAFHDVMAGTIVIET